MMQPEHFEQVPQPYLDPTRYPTGLKWVRAMLICGHVRRAALKCTSLWSSIKINHNSHEWTNLCLERAKSHPLSVHGTLTGLTDHTSASDLKVSSLQRANRIRLQLNASRHFAPQPDEINKLIKILFDTTYARRLESLELFSLRKVRASLPNSLPGDTLNHLTSLLLNSIKYHTLPSMPQLERLVVVDCSTDENCASLRRLLSQTPALTSLRLHSNYYRKQQLSPTMHHASYNPSQPVILPLLTALELSAQLSLVNDSFDDPDYRNPSLGRLRSRRRK
jgi:hypothetical protein